MEMFLMHSTNNHKQKANRFSKNNSGHYNRLINSWRRKTKELLRYIAIYHIVIVIDVDENMWINIIKCSIESLTQLFSYFIFQTSSTIENLIKQKNTVFFIWFFFFLWWIPQYIMHEVKWKVQAIVANNMQNIEGWGSILWCAHGCIKCTVLYAIFVWIVDPNRQWITFNAHILIKKYSFIFSSLFCFSKS